MAGSNAGQSIQASRGTDIAVTLKVSWGLRPCCRHEEFSCVLWSWRLPEGINYEYVHDNLKRKGFVVYAGQGDFSSQIFRIAHMGDITNADLDRLSAALGECFGGK